MAFLAKSFAAIMLLTLSVRAMAQTATPGAPAPAPAPPPDRAGSGSAVAGPTIPTPAPDADPAKVQEAKEVAKTAALTPIIPNQQKLPAFQLYAEIDVPVVAIGAVFTLARLVKVQPAYCAPMCDKTTLNNPLDKLTAGYWAPGWSTASDIGLYGLVVASGAILGADEGLLLGLYDGVVVVEAAMSANAVASIMTLAAGRPRPFLYTNGSGDYAAPLTTRNSADAGLSFLSSHTSMSFAIVTSMYIAEHRLHPHSNGPKVLLGVGLGVASFVGLARIMSGYHFITDVVGGAVVGSSLGVMISSIHPSPATIVPVMSDSMKGVGIQGTF